MNRSPEILTLNSKRSERRFLPELVLSVALVGSHVRVGHIADHQVAFRRYVVSATKYMNLVREDNLDWLAVETSSLGKNNHL